MSIVTSRSLFEKYKPYPKYRKSGVYWLEEIPELWDTKPIWVLFIRKSDKGHEELQLLSVYRDYGVIPKDSRNDNFNKPSLDLSNYLRVTPTDLVTNKMKTWQGSIAISEYEGIVSPAYYTCKAVHNEHHRYIHYLLRCEKYVSIYMSLSKGIRVNQWDLEYESFRKVTVLLPSLNEQQVIVDFLDRETAKIDELIARKQKLIELLQEQRTALITHAVTKGLNPDAPMKDCGLEWLVEIPAHWDVKKLKHVLLRNDGGVWGDDYDENGTAVLRSTEQTIDGKWCIDEPAMRRISAKEYKKSKLSSGDLLITKSSGSALHIGKATLVTKEIEDMNCCFSNFMQRLRLLKNHSAKYIYYVFNCVLGREQLVYYSNTTTGLANLSSTIIGNIHIAIPNYLEQQAITDYLDHETSRMDSLIGKINQAIEKLQEYRSALITAAVTGKIDVRQQVS